ncbi:MAG: hypothetical protein OEV08_00885 [Nitrospira sp.]|nr:hypothetical protein [Nitrospira sp.]
MAIDLTLKGVEITNREATPRVLNDPGRGEGAVEKCAYGYLASVTASLSITSIIRLVSVPSNAIVTDLRLSSAAQTAGAFDIGVYRTNADGGAVVDADLFGSAVSCASAVLNVDVLGESTQLTLAEQALPLWEAAGMSADPKSQLDIALTVATTDVTTGTGAIALRVRYVQ